jgi:hypothetical protein
VFADAKKNHSYASVTSRVHGVRTSELPFLTETNILLLRKLSRLFSELHCVLPMQFECFLIHIFNVYCVVGQRIATSGKL